MRIKGGIYIKSKIHKIIDSDKEYPLDFRIEKTGREGISRLIPEFGKNNLHEATKVNEKLLENIQKNDIYNVDLVYSDSDNTFTGEIEGLKEFGVFEGLKLKIYVDETNRHEETKLKLNDEIYQIKNIKIGSLQKENIYNLVYRQQSFYLEQSGYEFPVGMVLTFTNEINPNQIFPGIWERFAQGKTLIGVDSKDTEFSTVEKVGGSKTTTLTIEQIPAHTHSINADGNHIHGIHGNGEHAHTVHDHAHYVPGHNHIEGWSQNAGTFDYSRLPFGAHDLGGPWYVGPTSVYDYNNQISPKNSVTDMWTHGSQPGTTAAGWHGHGIDLAGWHTHTANNTGGSKEHSNLQPFITVYFWKRIK